MKFKESRLLMSGDKPDLNEYLDLLNEDEDFAEEFNRIFSNDEVDKADNQSIPEQYGSFINMELAIDREDEYPELGRVVKRRIDQHANPIGTANDDPILDTRIYQVEFQDGHIESAAANIIYQIIYSLKSIQKTIDMLY